MVIRRIAYSVILISWVVCGEMALAKDYPYFINEDGRVFYSDTNGSRLVLRERVEEAKKEQDCRPAEQDIDGHWGAVSNGMQASIRFERGLFATNDHITATVIMRNVGKEWRMFTMPLGLASCVSVSNQEQKQLERKDWADPQSNIGQLQRASHSQSARHVDPGMQRTLKIDIQEFYDLSLPVKYTVYVKMKTYPENSGDFKWVQSGNATIIITNSSR